MEDAMEKPKIGNQIPEKSPFSEKGRNVHITLKFIRHGLRNPSGELTDYGKEITRQKARESKSEKKRFNVVGAMGSDSGPIGPTGMQRSLETAHIYAEEIESDKRLQTRGTPILGYDTQINPIPFDWDKFYNDKLPANFATLSDEEKNKASKAAQAAALNHFMSLQTPEAINCRKEIAGSFARVIDHYVNSIKGVKSGTKALLPQGTHGGRMEPFLQEVLVRRLSNGQEIHSFEKVEEIGGEFDSSEAFNVEVATDRDGNLQKLKVTFDNKERVKRMEDEKPIEEMFLDIKKLQDLKDFYRSLHSKKS